MITVLFILLAAPDVPDSTSPGEIASSYRRIVAAYKADMKEAGQSRELRERASQVMAKGLELLIDRAAIAGHERLNESDYIALSESAERLRRLNSALGFAQLAIASGRQIESYITLVRCLCRVDQVEEAESSFAEAKEKFAQSQQLYLLPNFLALKHRTLGQHQKAFEYYRQTIDLIVNVVDDSPFFQAHLKRCLEEADDMAARCGKQGETPKNLLHWKQTLQSRLEVRLAGLAAISREELEALALYFSALIAVEERRAPENAETLLCNWMVTIRNLDKGNTLWYAGVPSWADAASRSLSPSFDGTAIEACVAESIKAINNLPNANQTQCLVASDAAKRLSTLKTLIGQHRRHRELIGRSLPFPRSEIKDAAAARLMLIHLVNPLSKSADEGLKSLRARHAELDSVSGIVVQVFAVQSGAVWDAQRNRLFREEPPSTADEAQALEVIRRATGTRETIHILPRDGELAAALQPELYPLNILLDANQKVLGILTGTEPEKLNRLVRLAKQEPPTQAAPQP